jgi:hypothetical protein
MPTKPTDHDAKENRVRGFLPDPDDTDSVIELSLRLARAARRRLPRHCRGEEV